MSAGFQTRAGESESADAGQLERLDLSTLVSGAARLRPERVALSDAHNQQARTLSFAELDRRADNMAAAWGQLGLNAGERVLFAGLASIDWHIAMLGALRAGLDVALVGPQTNAGDLARFARDSGVAAIAGQAGSALPDLSQTLLHCAATSERIRLVAALGEEEIDGAVSLQDFAGSQGDSGSGLTPASAKDAAHHARVITRDLHGRVATHLQRTLVAAALDFVSRAQIGTRLPLLSTIFPSSFAGLVAGPVASLAAGAPLILHAPFEGRALIEAIEALQPVHLVAPAMIGDELNDAGLITSDHLASLILLTRFNRFPADMPKEAARGLASAAVPVIDLYAIGESAALAEVRSLEGVRTPPLADAHILNFDGRELVVARRKLHYLARNGKLDTAFTIEGLGVSPGAGDDDEPE